MIKKQHSIPVPFPPVYPKLWHCLMLHSISPCEKKKKEERIKEDAGQRGRKEREQRRGGQREAQRDRV